MLGISVQVVSEVVWGKTLSAAVMRTLDNLDAQWSGE